jgi:hypothetical protein
MIRSVALLLAACLLSGVVSAQEDADLVNLAHLRHLTEPVTIDGQEMAVVHIYAEFPDYEWVDDADEGLSAVDDVARAAVLYLWEYERTGDASLLELARRCLNFVMYMQAEDGEFYNFVFDSQGTINLTGGTSYKSLTWWAMRGLWSLGEGVRVFDTVDPAYANELAAAYLKTEAALAATLGNYGEMTTIHGFDVPAWIPGGEPAVASIGLLGLTAYYRARPNETTADVITRIADGIAQYRLGTDSEYPFGAHPVLSNAPGFWHNWGAHMPHALVEAGMALDRPDWIESARLSADSFLLRQLAFEPFRHMGVVPYRREQIAYGTNMLVQAYAALYEATGDETYARYAGLAGSWYFGNNMASTPMVDLESGRVFDGINGPVSWRVNRNSGAESTIEGLMSLSVLARIPAAQPYLYVTPQPFNSFRALEAEGGERVIGTPVYYSGDWTGEGYISGARYVGLGEGQRMRLSFEVEQPDEYLLYIAHVRQASAGGGFVIPYTDTPPTIDADPSDWPPDAPRLDSNTARQFLRGAGEWDGADVDSHSVQLMWDEENLYVLATIRDPEHVQEQTLSNVWQGDALWLYFTASQEARGLSAKFTLARTPDGAQIWDWIHSRFAEGATLAWVAADGGYTYEAVIPFAAIDLDAPQAGTRIGFEAGRGVGGSGFMDLTGRDPDVAANLLQLTLVTPDSGAEAASTPNVALEIRLDDGEPVVLPETVSPDSDYFWLDLVTPQPVHLEPGEHLIRYEYAGEEDAANPGLSKIDAFYLQPAVARRAFTLPDGGTLTLTYNTLTGETRWDETPP